MPYTSKLDAAQARYDSAAAVLKTARDEFTAARRALEQAQGKAVSTEQRAANRQASRRTQVLRSNPQLRRMTGTARRQALDEILAKRDAPRVWRFYLDTMDYDLTTRTYKVRASNRRRYELYRAGLTLAAQMLRAKASRNVPGLSEPLTACELRDNARSLELHLQSLVDVSPREVRVHYPSEWEVISRALRPEGMKPRSKGARRLLALYQHIVRTHVEDV